MSTAGYLASQAHTALNTSNYPLAITLYTRALSHSPTSPDYYIQRSTAHSRLNHDALALRDAERAVYYADQRGSREGVGKAQLRRAVALYKLGRYADAGRCLEWAERRCAEAEKKVVAIWRVKGVEEGKKVEEEEEEKSVEKVETKEEKKEAEKKEAAAAPPPPPPPAGVTTDRSKIRHEWYQSKTHVVLTIYAKGIPADQTTITINPDSLHISIPLPTGPAYTFTLHPLHPLSPSTSTTKILPAKLELTLTKSTPNQQWSSLGSISLDSSPPPPLPSTSTTSTTTTTTTAPRPPAYPTSSKSGPKDWDRLANELTKKSSSGDSKEGDGDEDEDEEGDPVNAFFKKLYKDADDDTRRAMMKSYIESNGTALSTNWGEVGGKRVGVSPPKGMEAKKWDS
ncbi:SGS-domain-containing protein [Ascodesmis nigricans]|uniref:SGS-domain-containing protein n=1 Tax=Ascodesmis nigricans TaxID=341454 RepID=A0A4S2N0N0_9PEZI|nr:SGS-domain-containing protein [Ascodesmis nigricans]